ELAAALAVVRARAAAAASLAPAAPRRPDEWADKTRAVRGGARPQPGPTAWSRTYWPH
ncbi:acyl-CoA carboxylase epsilon subunit, partial [Streptomyces caeni]